jgi:hypothetical protein
MNTRPRLVVSTTDGQEHLFYQGSDTYLAGNVLIVNDTGHMPATTTRFSLANVIKWEVADRE